MSPISYPGRSWYGFSGLLRHGERAIKSRLFGCQMCGQCLLSQTGRICPMRCPKGLRNGPCGGTLDGACEVYPDRRCVWVEIHGRRQDGESVRPLETHAPVDGSLFEGSSVFNFFSGIDRATRRPLPALELTPDPCETEQTESSFESKLRSRELTITAELRSPRESEGLGRLRSDLATLAPVVDALNSTSDHGGGRTLSSIRVAREVLRGGSDAIPHICGRDVDSSRFLDRLLESFDVGVRNVLCLTGDWRSDSPDAEALPYQGYFPMESAQMIYEARGLRESSTSVFSELGERTAPRLFVGAAINPASTPRRAVLARLAQKIACGVDFIQTQAVCDAEAFLDWLRDVEESGLRERVFILPSVPIVGSRRGWEILGQLPGVQVPADLAERMETARDVSLEGDAVARETVSRLLESGNIDGVHFLSFGASASKISELVLYAREIDSRREVAESGTGFDLLGDH